MDASSNVDIEAAASTGSPGGAGAAELVRQAVEYTKESFLYGRPTGRGYVEELRSSFGQAAVLLLGEIVAALQKDATLSAEDLRHVNAEFTLERLRAGKNGKPVPRASTVDELFRRSLEHRASGAFYESLDFVSRFRQYAAYNNWLVHIQRPRTRFWASESDWRTKFGRSLREGALPMLILQFMGPVMMVYDVADTDGPDLPDSVLNPFAVQGAHKPEWTNRLVDQAAAAGIRVAGAGFEASLAGCAFRSADEPESPHFFGILLNGHQTPTEQFGTLLHELAHVYLGHVGEHPRKRWLSRVGLRTSQNELEAEAVAYVVASRLGLATYSAEYLAPHLENEQDLQEISVDAVVRVSGRLERTIAPQLSDEEVDRWRRRGWRE